MVPLRLVEETNYNDKQVMRIFFNNYRIIRRFFAQYAYLLHNDFYIDEE